MAAIGLLLARVTADSGHIERALEMTRQSLQLSRGVIGHTTAHGCVDMASWLSG